jgi:hypothetical protein
LVHSALNACSTWLETFENKKIIKLDLIAWLSKYETTNHDIIGISVEYTSNWKWDNFLIIYSNLRRFAAFLEDFILDVDRLNKTGETQLGESELIPWILDIERRMEESYYYEIFGKIFQIDGFGPERKIKVNYGISFRMDEGFIAPFERFLTWFDLERKKLVVKYFSLTQAEVDDYLENSDEFDAFYKIGSQLSFQLDTREKFRKNGIYIPYDLGGAINPFLFGEGN